MPSSPLVEENGRIKCLEELVPPIDKYEDNFQVTVDFMGSDFKGENSTNVCKVSQMNFVAADSSIKVTNKAELYGTYLANSSSQSPRIEENGEDEGSVLPSGCSMMRFLDNGNVATMTSNVTMNSAINAFDKMPSSHSDEQIELNDVLSAGTPVKSWGSKVRIKKWSESYCDTFDPGGNSTQSGRGTTYLGLPFSYTMNNLGDGIEEKVFESSSNGIQIYPPRGVDTKGVTTVGQINVASTESQNSIRNDLQKKFSFPPDGILEAVDQSLEEDSPIVIVVCYFVVTN